MREKIIQILADTLGLDAAGIAPAFSSSDTPAWDSMAQLNIVLSLEQTFGVRFEPEEFIGLSSIAAIEEALRAKGAA